MRIGFIEVNIVENKVDSSLWFPIMGMLFCFCWMLFNYSLGEIWGAIGFAVIIIGWITQLPIASDNKHYTKKKGVEE